MDDMPSEVVMSAQAPSSTYAWVELTPLERDLDALRSLADFRLFPHGAFGTPTVAAEQSSPHSPHVEAVQAVPADILTWMPTRRSIPLFLLGDGQGRKAMEVCLHLNCLRLHMLTLPLQMRPRHILANPDVSSSPLYYRSTSRSTPNHVRNSGHTAFLHRMLPSSSSVDLASEISMHTKL
jgi:hypothetical protein